MSRSAEEQQIVDFLEASPETWYSAVEISRKAGRRRQFDENPRWAVPLLARLRDQGTVEDDGGGHFRLADREGA